MYDGVDAAVSLLAQADLAGGSVIVMSDGADTGSDTRLAEAAAHARADGIRVFSVGLQSSAFRPDPLRELASDSRGSYSEAGSGRRPAPIYDRLGAELSNEYLVQYRSLQGPSSRVKVRVTVDGIGSATASYRSPDEAVAPRRRTSATTSGALRSRCAGQPGRRWPGGPRLCMMLSPGPGGAG